MSQKMLIDAKQNAEIRVAIIDNEVLTELDCQNLAKRPTKGNIYLARVVRVEPSLQAAFLDYGGLKHGFLPFSEIHPDYYQLPVSDRKRLIEELEAVSKHHSEDDVAHFDEGALIDDSHEDDEEVISLNTSVIDEIDEDEQDHRVEVYKRYKIQEVIRKDQIILIQIDKEERGNKGAALTSYISIAGRYCVLMPNSTKCGGVSKKIEDAKDRGRLKTLTKEITKELELSGAMIVRTAGAGQTKEDIKRDAQYLKYVWDKVRKAVIKSNAPAFIHEEGNAIKKALRDLYNENIGEIWVEGEEAYKEAKEFIKVFLTKHTGKLKHYTANVPIMHKYGVEAQIAGLYDSHVMLKSGGYLVINQTEALVAIDINSGKATSERNVESTALRTNMEAASEIARQLKLRDLSGLIVIDFIDMSEIRHKKSVEKALKDALSGDKAKIQVGRISHFGLLEMSRQRLKHSFFEMNTVACEHCMGIGRIRHNEASAIAILRAIRNEITSPGGEIKVSACASIISYMLNNMRQELLDLENLLQGKVILVVDDSTGSSGFFIERSTHKVDKAQEALSTMDVEPMDMLDAQDSPLKKRKRKKKIKGKNRDASAAADADTIEQPDILNDNDLQRENPENVVYLDEEVKSTPKESKRRRPKKRFAEREFKNRTEVQPEDEKIEDDMVARREANQSLLKEIWKRIVD